VRFSVALRSSRSRAWWLAVLVVSLSTLPGWPQTPIDPLQLLDQSIGRLMWTVAFGYSASGREGLGFDGFGDPYNYTLLEQDEVLSFSATTGLSATTSMGATTALLRTDTTESRQYEDAEIETTATGKGISCVIWEQFHVDVASEADPRLTLSVGYPAAAAGSISVSLLKDPIVLAAEVGVRAVKDPPSSWIVLDLGVGFVANTWIRLTTFAGLEVPAGSAGLPTARIGEEVRYTLNVDAGREMALRAMMVVRGERTSLRVELELSGG
jgi:hypothetical protein